MGNHVKGVFFKEYVRMMRRRKDVDWSGRLQADDRKYLDERIVDTEWYPIEAFERLGLAVFAEVAGGDLEASRQWGRTNLENLMSVHGSLLCGDDPRETLIRFQVARRGFLDFNPVRIQVLQNNLARVEISFGMTPPGEHAAAFQTLGYLELLLECSGASNIQHRFVGRKWEGAARTMLELEWSEIPPGSKVKGIVFVDYVRMLKSLKGRDLSAYLRPQDLHYLTVRINPSEWYPFETFERMGLAILREIAGNDMEKVRLFGRLSMDYLFKTHDTLISRGDPMESLMRFQVLRRSFFDFEALNLRSLRGDYAKFEISYGMVRAAEEAASYQSLGFFERLLELSEAKNVHFKFSSKTWAGDPTTTLELNWTAE